MTNHSRSFSLAAHAPPKNAANPTTAAIPALIARGPPTTGLVRSIFLAPDAVTSPLTPREPSKPRPSATLRTRAPPPTLQPQPSGPAHVENCLVPAIPAALASALFDSVPAESLRASSNAAVMSSNCDKIVLETAYEFSSALRDTRRLSPSPARPRP